VAFLGVDLVVLRVRDMGAAEAFYRDRFGVPVGPGVTPASRTLFLAGGPHVDLAPLPAGAAPGPEAGHIELRMVVDDLAATHAAFLAAGVEVVHPPTGLPGGAREMVAADMDGHLWRFTEPHRPR
jgi:catechol 2,3-dioxygenase-like lactoylglutathione lyase family enzyme